MTKITAAELKTIKERCSAKPLTPAPWQIEQNGDGIWDVHGPSCEFVSAHDMNGESTDEKRRCAADAVFIANAREDLPRLVSAYEELQALVRRYLVAVAKMEDYADRGQDDSGRRETPGYREWLVADCEYTEAAAALRAAVQ